MQNVAVGPCRLLFKAFLSHRYKSPAVNLFFHKIFAGVAGVQFEVDVGQLSTSVTRLERMIRDADAFVGIYPFPCDALEIATRDRLMAESRYFRLEVELAARAGKPALIYYDRRYAPVLDLPASIRREVFDLQEVENSAGSSNQGRFETVFRRFVDEMEGHLTAKATRARPVRDLTVGLLLPGGRSSGYGPAETEAIRDVLAENNVAEIVPLPWPPRLDGRFLSKLESLDWLVLDIGPEAMRTGVPGFVHGQAVPSIRLLQGKLTPGDLQRPSLGRALFTGVEVGYPKDVLTWADIDDLRAGLARRLGIIMTPTKLIATPEAAVAYFQQAALRKEAVFVSYSGRDEALARPIAAALRTRFQTVFDYKDGESITPGEPWMKEIFDKLSTSALGIPLVSSSYLKSGNCLHEAREMVALLDAGRISMVPVKLYQDDAFDPPSWMRDRQYMRLYDYPDPATAAAKLVGFFDSARQPGTT